MEIAEAQDHVPESMSLHEQTQSEDWLEGLRAFNKKRKPFLEDEQKSALLPDLCRQANLASFSAVRNKRYVIQNL